MISNKPNSQFHNQLKARFFDLVTHNGATDWMNFLEEMEVVIKETLGAANAHVYIYNASENTFRMISSEGDDTLAREINAQYWSGLRQHHGMVGSPIKESSFQEDTYRYFIPLTHEGEVFGLVGVTFHTPEHLTFHHLETVGEEVSALYLKMRNYYQSLDEEKRHERLFRVTAKFHSSMNMDDVLGEIIDTLRQLYPEFEYYLLLSHDYSSSHDLPIRELVYDSDGANRSSAQAYLTGEMQFEESWNERQSCFYAPLKGKQGVYGVLQVVAPKSIHFLEEDINFITLLANTAGNALENARLYQQSKRLISDLQLINETSHKLNSNLRLSDTISFLSNQIRQSFDAEQVGVLLFKDGEARDYEVLKESSSFFYQDKSEELLRYITDSIGAQRDALFIGDFSVKNPSFYSPYQSVMAIPMIQTESLKGVVIVMHTDPYFFSFETFKLLQSLVHHSTLAFANSMLREELEQLVSTDYLTKLYSRKHLDETIHKHFVKDRDGSFIIVDIDNFKKVNDTYGHQEGDRVIIEVSNLLKREIENIGITARWGGEELAIYLPEIDLDEAYEIGEKLVNRVRGYTTPRVTISCGVSYWNKSGDGRVVDLFRRADRALYEAKESGKDCIKRETNNGQSIHRN
ncbi:MULTISPECIES: sensor domain-containing diguanylate cyclase [Pontibacillus]|uniref:Diguanylate cyclase n=1 Tax=Pontibacillus chungwhensis TaxID=265426 RepID=A0ABY8UU94_9BACI|nr:MULTISPECIES: diguanylate cyclase [Pontibacillus]MCD5323878.1 diguanylate cyclase [Pontibacillus sp. HN14]WIF97236.1 diguanylate cyclase [Pontibacillus chungwhensis]